MRDESVSLVKLQDIPRGGPFWNMSPLAGGPARWFVVGPCKRYPGYIECRIEGRKESTSWRGDVLVRDKPPVLDKMLFGDRPPFRGEHLRAP